MWYKKTALVLAAIGAINWGFNALDWNLVEMLIGSWAGMTVTAIVYYLVAIAGIYALYLAVKE